MYFYARTTFKHDGLVEDVFMHRYITKVDNNFMVDHADGNGLNNQKSNLRIASRSQNTVNSTKFAHNKGKKKKV